MIEDRDNRDRVRPKSLEAAIGNCRNLYQDTNTYAY